jgi:hypothetical protein
MATARASRQKAMVVVMLMVAIVGLQSIHRCRAVAVLITIKTTIIVIALHVVASTAILINAMIVIALAQYRCLQE